MHSLAGDMEVRTGPDGLMLTGGISGLGPSSETGDGEGRTLCTLWPVSQPSLPCGEGEARRE